MVFKAHAVQGGEANEEILPAKTGVRYRILHLSVSVADDATGEVTVKFGTSAGKELVFEAPAGADMILRCFGNKNDMEGGIGEGLTVDADASSRASISVIYEELPNQT